MRLLASIIIISAALSLSGCAVLQCVTKNSHECGFN